MNLLGEGSMRRVSDIPPQLMRRENGLKTVDSFGVSREYLVCDLFRPCFVYLFRDQELV